MALGVLSVTQANANLGLTAQGTALGFSLSQFVLTNPGNNGCCNGPFGVAMDVASGHMLVNVGNGTRYVFSDVNGQTLGSALGSVSSDTYVGAYATAAGKAYGGSYNNGNYYQFNSDGTINHQLTGVTASSALGMWGNPVNGHIVSVSNRGLIDIDPLANGGLGTFRVINSANGDGVSISPDGKTVYLAAGNIVAYDIATGAQTGSFAPGAGSGLDCTGVITRHRPRAERSHHCSHELGRREPDQPARRQLHPDRERRNTAGLHVTGRDQRHHLH
jgi:hypothetical protein